MTELFAVLIGALAGSLLTLLGQWLLSKRPPRLPRAPRCRAVLSSGEQCQYDVDHDGYHRTTVYLGDQVMDHCWEDPDCGVKLVRWERY